MQFSAGPDCDRIKRLPGGRLMKMKKQDMVIGYGKNRTILLVDDEEKIVEVCRLIWKKRDMRSCVPMTARQLWSCSEITISL